jgi:hypothetical protein
MVSGTDKSQINNLYAWEDKKETAIIKEEVSKAFAFDTSSILHGTICSTRTILRFVFLLYQTSELKLTITFL